jgi:hypothetical protein
MWMNIPTGITWSSATMNSTSASTKASGANFGRAEDELEG